MWLCGYVDDLGKYEVIMQIRICAKCRLSFVKSQNLV